MLQSHPRSHVPPSVTYHCHTSNRYLLLCSTLPYTTTKSNLKSLSWDQSKKHAVELDMSMYCMPFALYAVTHVINL